MAGTPGRRRRPVVKAVGAVLALAALAQHGGPGGVDKGRVVAEIVITESTGAFRDVARLLFLIVAAAETED